jgi:hypothetical protein
LALAARTQLANLFNRYAEQPFSIKAPQIRLKGLSLAHEGSLVRKGLSERVKAPVEIDVVNDDSSSGRQGFVAVLQFKSDIAVGMGAVVDE